jgi:hypothetical protein
MVSDPDTGQLISPNYVNPSYITPEQQAQLRLYANSLLHNAQTMPVKNWAQGLAQLANAGVGGLLSGRADQQQRQILGQSQQEGTLGNALQQGLLGGTFNPPGATTPSSTMAYAAPDTPPQSSPAVDTGNAAATVPAGANPLATPPSNISDNSGIMTPAEVAQFIAEEAPKHGIDPQVATAMFQGESGLDPTQVGDNKTSFGVTQLHYDPKGAALGNEFTADTGLDAKDPRNTQAAIIYSLEAARKYGWTPWANTQKKLGFDTFQGIGPLPQAQDATTPPAQVASNAPMAAPAMARRVVSPAAAGVGSIPPGGAVGMNVGPASSAPMTGAPAIWNNNPMQVAGNINQRVPGMGFGGPPGLRIGAPVAGPPGLKVGPAAAAPGMKFAPPAPASPALAAISAGAPPLAAALGAGATPPQQQSVSPQIVAALRSGQVDPRLVGSVLASPNIPQSMKEQIVSGFSPQLYDTGPGVKGIGSPYGMMNGALPTTVMNPGFQTTMRVEGAGEFPQYNRLDASGNINTSPLVPGAAAPLTPGAPAGMPPAAASAPNPAATTGPTGRTPGQTNVAPPPGANNFMAPGSPVGDLIQQGRENAAAKQQLIDTRENWAKNYSTEQQRYTTILNQGNTLNSLQAIIDKNGGNLPTGHGADDITAVRSIGNLVSSYLGHPLSEEEGKDTSTALWGKYSTQIAQTLAHNFNANPTNFDFSTILKASPNTEMSGAPNIHLVDNLIRLNNLDKLYNQNYIDYYNKSNGDMSNFNNYFNHVIGRDDTSPGSPNAFALSKFPVDSKKRPNGEVWDKVQSTSPTGFSWKLHGTY